MTTRISSNNLDTSVTAQFGPKISGIAIANNSYTVLDDTAVSTSGGYIIITGSNFATGCSVLIGSVVATSVSFINSTTVRAQVPAQAAGSYTVYLTNPDGGVALRINGLNYSATPTWSTTSPLPTNQVNSAISIQLAATSNGNVSYALQAGSSLPSGVTLSNVGLISGTVTGITTETTYNFTVVATDTELQDTPQAFSITITSNDQYFKNTSLLLSANTPGTTFVADASTNAFNITVNGDTRPNNFSPYYGGYYSNYFDGSGDNVSVPTNAAFNLSANNFTFEAWIYPISITNTSAVIASQWGLNGDEGIWQVGITSNNFYLSYDTDGAVPAGTSTISTSGGISFNSWQHVLVTRTASGGNSLTRLFINGVLQAYDSRAAYSITSSASPVRLGMQGFTGYRNGEPFQGYISNFRFCNGSVPADYTTSSTTVGQRIFTPSLTPLTTSSQGATAADVKLLMAQSNRFVDNSANNFTVTRNGDTRVDGFVPFVPDSSYATYGSGYFDGSGDYLSIADNPAFLITGDFTVEAWVYQFSSKAVTVIGQWPQSATTSFIFRIGSDGKLGFAYNIGGEANGTVSTGAITYNSWNHVVWTRSGTTLRYFINGIQDATTVSLNGAFADSAASVLIGAYNTSVDTYFNGYISDVRFIKGASLYTANFTPPTLPLTAVANTSLLTLQTNQSHTNNQFVDRSTNNFLITRAGNTTAGSFSPYAGGWSNYFDGTGDYLTVPTNTAFAFAKADLTVEMWIYPTATITTPANIGLFYIQETSGLVVGLSNGYIALGRRTLGYDLTSSYIPPLNTWTHIAVTRYGATAWIFANGVQVGTVTASAGDANNNANYVCTTGLPTVAGDYGGGAGFGYFPGHISNLRVVKGTAVYTANFTPPTQPLTPITGTSLLTCADNRFVDDSANNFTITRNGDVSVQKFSPFSMQTQIVPTSHSVYFDGNGDYLTVASSSAFNISGNFTVEGWYYFTALPGSGTNDNLWTFSGATTYNPYLYLWGDGTIILRTEQTSGTVFSVTHNFALNTWYHIAVVKSSTNFTLYVNGTSVGTGTSSAIVSQNKSLEIGGQSTFGLTGYLSNFRVVNGTAVYTANFTPATAPLTAIANTSLLACQSTTLVDNSTNAFAITANGNSQPLPQNPFGYTNPAAGAYTTTALGGSMHWGTRTNYLSVPASNLIKSFSGDFTVEAWIYRTDTTLFNWGLLDMRQDGQSPNPLVFGLEALATPVTGQSRMVFYNGTTYYGTGIIHYNSWTHVAWSRSGTTLTFYVNGVAGGTATISGTQTGNASTNPIYIGSKDTGLSNYGTLGYISDLRITNGTAVYTSAFVPPAAPVGAVRNTTLLLPGTAAGIHDSTMNNNIETVGGSRINTSIVKFAGKSSVIFNGSGDYLMAPSSPNFAFGTGDYTIEAWVYPTSIRNGENLIYATDVTGGTAFGFNQTQVYIGARATGYDLQITYTVQANTWTHLVVARQNGTARIFANGTLIGSGSVSRSCPQGPAGVGDYPTLTGNGITGYISDLRITRGLARYTANFTAPTSPFIQY